MAQDRPQALRLSIWRNFEPVHTLGMQDGEAGWKVVDRPSDLQEEVYSWSLLQDPFGGIDDDHVRDDVRGALLDRLDVSLPPTDRGIAVLGEFVTKAEQAVQEGHAGPLPADSASASTHTPSEPNPLLALALHCKWLVRCFGDRPGVSVSVR